MRPSHIWMVFLACLAVLLAAMGWVTGHTLRLEKTRQEANAAVARQERVRLAMYRLDFAASGLVIRENARPVQDFQSFHAADSVFNKAYVQVQKGEVLVPSPLLSGIPEDALLHFQINGNGQVASPQVPEGNARDLAESGYAEPDKIVAAERRLAALREVLLLPVSRQIMDVVPEAACSAWVEKNRTIADNWLLPPQAAGRREAPAPSVANNSIALWAFNGQFEQPVQAPMQLPIVQEQAQPAPAPQQMVQIDNANDLQLRSQNAMQQKEQTLPAPLLRKEMPQKATSRAVGAAVADGKAAAPDVVRPLQGFWLDDKLLLTRSATVDGHPVVQGVWLDWERLRTSWLTQVRDLFPSALLEAAPLAAISTTADDPFRLATLPVKLIPGEFLAAPPAGWTPLQSSLAVAWLCVLLAAAAVAVLLHRTVALSERRASFVSAVTHELRTPLTTFRLYSEMLADDMVPDAEVRRNYLQTLHGEANRLGHLVENVLAFARLERGSARRKLVTQPLRDVLGSILPRLEQRAQAAEAAVVLKLSPQTESASLHTDLAALEQILFNLVDNACKYALPTAQDRTIEIFATTKGSRVEIHVRDHGPGVPKREVRRIFRPFHKSADQAARSAPGVGLGLALCRRLCGEIGGTLRHERCPEGPGACFVVDLPAAVAL